MGRAHGGACPVTLNVTSIDGRSALTIRNAEKVAEFLFRFDPSSATDYSYDGWIAEQAHPHHFRDQDIKVMNRTMAARSPYEAWADFLDRDLPRLSALDPEWDLFALGDGEWAIVRGPIAEALRAMLGPRRNLAVVTKMLHMKRQKLIPVCDSYIQKRVLGCVLGPASPESLVSSGMDLICHLRDQGKRNLDGLLAIQGYLASHGVRRTTVRILDMLLWSSHPEARWRMLEPLLAEWFGTGS